jgi:hypothetical protein
MATEQKIRQGKATQAMKVTPHIGGNCSPHLCKLLSTLVKIAPHICANYSPHCWKLLPTFVQITLHTGENCSPHLCKLLSTLVKIAPHICANYSPHWWKCSPIFAQKRSHSGIKVPLFKPYCFADPAIVLGPRGERKRGAVASHHCLQYRACALLCVWQVCMCMCVCVCACL